MSIKKFCDRCDREIKMGETSYNVETTPAERRWMEVCRQCVYEMFKPLPKENLVAHAEG